MLALDALAVGVKVLRELADGLLLSFGEVREWEGIEAGSFGIYEVVTDTISTSCRFCPGCMN
jgi:hypothetical protein